MESGFGLKIMTKHFFASSNNFLRITTSEVIKRGPLLPKLDMLKLTTND